ncbi:hypothetical protein CHH79_17685 [Bacillus siamensis]|nr:hypothetical protein [Bacillus siamensis]MED0773327.1 hypothetical protein [Bacillus siamensis]MED0775105.1 hypothetical protein [Bacillus siamensis]MED0781150.1 hypothetical protein [Bacillus siamensis]MED0834625.1 hypothetical protein [Bacillus siamensis]MED5048672.1 hypothetical protein [Bacillus siamensis]
MKKYLYKHLLLALISSVCFLMIFYFGLRMTQEDTPPLSSYPFYLFIYMYIAAGYLTVGLLSACMTDVLKNRWTLNKTSSILLKLIVYLLITYAISRSFFVLSAPLIYLLFESLFILRKAS